MRLTLCLTPSSGELCTCLVTCLCCAIISELVPSSIPPDLNAIQLFQRWHWSPSSWATVVTGQLSKPKSYLGWVIGPLHASQTFCINNCINEFECSHTQRYLQGKDANHSRICCKDHSWKVKGILHAVISSLSYIDFQGEFYPWKLSEFQTGTAFRGD